MNTVETICLLAGSGACPKCTVENLLLRAGSTADPKADREVCVT